jgi:8-oxo-dGTP pyrophosphatase MutT (NUDIX family)
MIDKKTQLPVFLLIKRQAMSKKIERIAPKGKIQSGETAEKAALREIEEEVGLLRQNMQVKQKLDTLSLQLYMDDGSL